MSRFSVLALGVAAIAAVSLVAPGAASAAPKRQLTITAASRTMTYGGSEPALGYLVAGLAKGDSLTRKPTCSVPTHRAAGKYTISCSGARANSTKYTIRYVSGTFAVGKATLTIAANYLQKYYAAEDPTSFAYSTAGLVRGDTFATRPNCDVDEPHTDAGRYVITCGGADAGPNYTIRYLAQFYDVLTSPLLVGPTQQYAYYGSKEPDFTHRVFGLKDGDELDAVPACAVDGEHEHVGTYTIECVGAEASDNYDLKVVTNTFTVLQTGSYVVGERPVIRQGLLGPTSGKLVATLYVYLDGAFAPTAAQRVSFTAGDTVLCSGAVTDSAGQATCALDANAATIVRNGGYTVTYTGDADIAGSHHDVDNG